jgi:hypothetical protein
MRAAFTPKPQPSDTRPFLARLLASIRPVLKFSKKRFTYIGIKGGADF